MKPNARISSTADAVLGSPARNLLVALSFVFLVFVTSTVGYMAAGWSLSDAAYMVTLTVFSVGYDEVHPIDTEYLRALTMGTIFLGCTGMIVLTGALVQVFTVLQLRKMLGFARMQTQIDKLADHVIICGFGRIGIQLASELLVAGTGFVIVERNMDKVSEAHDQGFLCISGDATEEGTLHGAGIDRARVLATVLPNDAANVFITLSARNINPKLFIIARGEAPTTEKKLFHAGANKVVLPTHIGAERIAEMILYPATDHYVEGSLQLRDMKRTLREHGLELQAVTVNAVSTLAGTQVAEAERRGQGGFFILQIDRANGQSISHPGRDVPIEAGDTVILLVRSGHVSIGTMFSSPRGRMRVGRSEF